jgi:hypothetical protein
MVAAQRNVHRRIGMDNRILAYHVSDRLVPTTDMLLDRGMMGDGVHTCRPWPASGGRLLRAGRR